MEKKVLIIEDEITLTKSLGKLLKLWKCIVDEASDLKTAAKKICNYDYDIFLLDLKFTDGNGIDLLKKHKVKMEDKTIVITAHATISSAVDAIKNGASYYLEKPLDEELLFIQMEKITGLIQLKKKNVFFKNELISNHSSDKIIYSSREMSEIVEIAEKHSKTDNIVLIQGNTGVGKEIIAKFIHANSKRKNKIFLPINCSSIPEQLFESELFGFKKGAFTGASENYSGRFIQADGGTLFLDEIAEIPSHLQAKLLRVLEDGVIYQLGNIEPKKTDVRLLVATNKDLWKEAQLNRFRKDLYFRLRESTLSIPPLRERKDDIIPLIWHFMAIFNKLFDKSITRITREAESYLKEYPWEGNVRELKNMVKSILSLKNNDKITINDIKLVLHEDVKNSPSPYITLRDYELAYIQKVLESNNFNIKKASEVLNVSRSRLYRKIRFLNINMDKKSREETKNV